MAYIIVNVFSPSKVTEQVLMSDWIMAHESGYYDEMNLSFAGNVVCEGKAISGVTINWWQWRRPPQEKTTAESSRRVSGRIGTHTVGKACRTPRT